MLLLEIPPHIIAIPSMGEPCLHLVRWGSNRIFYTICFAAAGCGLPGLWVNLCFNNANPVQCKPDISRSCISRNWIYRGRMLDPIFLPTDFANFADVVPKSAIFSRNRGNSLHSIRGRQFFAKSAHRDSLCSCSLETIFREINSSLPVNAGWNTCCAMGSHARRSIDTSIVSQSRVQLIQCQCKSRLQTANLGINNAFNQIAVWPRCLHPPFCPSLRQFRSKSSVRDW